MRSSLALLSLAFASGLAFAPPITTRCKLSTKGQSRPLYLSQNGVSSLFLSSRSEFLTKSVASFLSIIIPSLTDASTANAFDGGVGGLGKTRPVTGVVFRDPEGASGTGASSSGNDVTNELLAPDGTPAFVTFTAPWPLLKSAAGIEARDISGGFESSYVQVAELPKGTTSMDSLKPAFLSQVIFGSSGKFGMYGAPTDIKIKKIAQSNSGMTVFLAAFTTLTPAMRESDRKAYISASIVGNGLFMLVTSTTAARFNKFEGQLRNVADSFAAIPAPKSGLRKTS